jgi:hypothetical protein
MKIVGCDLLTCYQQIAMLDAETPVSAKDTWSSLVLAWVGSGGMAAKVKIPTLCAKDAQRMGHPLLFFDHNFFHRKHSVRSITDF